MKEKRIVMICLCAMIVALSVSGTVSANKMSYPLVKVRDFRMMYAEAYTNFSEENLTWWGGAASFVKIISFVFHYFEWNLTYEVYTFDENVTQPICGSYCVDDVAYLFKFRLTPMIKPIIDRGNLILFPMFKTGNFTLTLYIDGEQYYQIQEQFTHH